MKSNQDKQSEMYPWLSHSTKFLLVSLLFVFSCGEKDISGSWTGLTIYENGTEMPESKAELCSLRIEDGGYFFRGNTGVIEKGLLKQKKKLLYMQDTLREKDAKQIAYKLIGKDTLELLMNDQSNALRLTMKRKEK